MARRRRSRRQSDNLPPALTVEYDRDTAGMWQQLRAHCPQCGMMANIENFGAGPYEADTQIQYFGAGKIFYEPAPEHQEDAWRLMLEYAERVVEYLRDQLGVADEEPESDEDEEESDEGDEFDEEEEDDE